MDTRDDRAAERNDGDGPSHGDGPSTDDGYAPGYWRVLPNLVRPREQFVELPALGRPSSDERNWRRAAAGMGMREHREARFRAITLDEWVRHLEGDDVAWCLRAVRYLRYIVARHEERIVLRAIDGGFGWDAIGSYLGVSRQAVAQRFGRLLDEAMGVARADGSPAGTEAGSRRSSRSRKDR